MNVSLCLYKKGQGAKALLLLSKVSVQLLNCVRLFVTPWTAAHQASLSITNSQNLIKLMSIEARMPFNHLNICHPVVLPPSIFPSIRVFSSESVLWIRWLKYWSFSFNIGPYNECSGLFPVLTKTRQNSVGSSFRARFPHLAQLSSLREPGTQPK